MPNSESVQSRRDGTWAGGGGCWPRARIRQGSRSNRNSEKRRALGRRFCAPLGAELDIDGGGAKSGSALIVSMGNFLW